MNNILAISSVVIKEMCRRKDFYVLFILTALITLTLGGVHFFGDDKMIRYLKEICLLLIWISSLVIAIATTARQLPAEKEQRTIFPLLAKPVSRAEVILGKFLGCWLACGLCLLVFYTFFCVICATREHEFHLGGYLLAIWLHWIMLGIVAAATLAGSIVFAAPSSNGTTCFVCTVGILMLGRHLNKVALQLAEPAGSILYTIYYFIPHLEWFDLRDKVIHTPEMIQGRFVGLATLYGAAYTAFFLYSAWLLFRRKPLN